MNFTLIKKHPYATGAVVIVGGIIVFLIMRNSAGGTGDGTVADTSGYSSDPRIAAIQAGADVQNGQTQGQLQMATLQAEVINNQTTAALQATKLTAERDVQIAQIQGDTQVETVHTQAIAYGEAIDASTKQAQINADASVRIADDRDAIVAQQIQLESNIVTQAGKDKSRSSTGWAQIISSIEGQGPQAIAANEPAAVASSPGAILHGIADVGSSILEGLFA